jgi:hypothetical protein
MITIDILLGWRRRRRRRRRGGGEDEWKMSAVMCRLQQSSA